IAVASSADVAKQPQLAQDSWRMVSDAINQGAFSAGVGGVHDAVSQNGSPLPEDAQALRRNLQILLTDALLSLAQSRRTRDAQQRLLNDAMTYVSDLFGGPDASPVNRARELTTTIGELSQTIEQPGDRASYLLRSADLALRQKNVADASSF